MQGKICSVLELHWGTENALDTLDLKGYLGPLKRNLSPQV